ncbi:7-carboxy-7-deazaguanine synthase QueE [Rickettsiales endosymbiont of Peranema trichophorum]|uniref:7-carboxy-7-deazaguanine synthase QueE n=1 Tax=Rickettsiales endosymbiont of Peranema trichophorum TaxID=2486577 RepID=UPI001023449C|nr:7-carboxy-7-deazaguanine synthase QueE [Rickettsiales endosymbiont of Peranema trichophorum]RZI46714.1 7-carboxy-7-deazaguanine synthase QueE [Rickettsiales endosymbiont of Peranema trichophorum]
MAFGNNPKLPPDFGDGEFLKVVSIYYTIQGEGPYVGFPSVFVRLGGCNLACTFCDTEFDVYQEMHISKIVEKIQEYPHKPLIVITGGEPFRQTIGPLCTTLVSLGYHIQIESNGTLYREIPSNVEIVCSPKSLKGDVFYIAPGIYKHLTAYKFLISTSNQSYLHIPKVVHVDLLNKVYIQPIDELDQEKNAANLSLAIRLAMEHGYKLSLQIHKIINLP